MTEASDNIDLQAIQARLGRPLRVLHIGNIANNAYNNARIQRQHGIEADVLSYDYYHVMSTPEWEDAQFEGEIDPDVPNWWETSLRGWRRPDWFVQGPASGCLQYLRAKHFGYRRLQKLLWLSLEARCLGYVRYMAAAKGNAPHPMPLRLGVALKAAEGFGVANGPELRVSDAATAAVGKMFLAGAFAEPGEALGPSGLSPPPQPSSGIGGAIVRKASLFCKGVYRTLLDAFVIRGVRNPAKETWLSALWLRRRLANDGVSRADVLAEIDRNPTGMVQLRSLASDVAVRFEQLVRQGRNKASRALSKVFYRACAREARKLSVYNSMIDVMERDASFVRVLGAAKEDIARLPAEERKKFIEYYSVFGAQFLDIFDLYDIIQTYATDGCLCVVNGHERFISYEHGTIRELPFGNDFYGIVTRLAYHASTYVFVTNTDVLPSAKRMKLDPSRVVCLPHAFDDRKLARFRIDNSALKPPDGPPVIFSPTRQHWKDRSGSWTKGNDILFRAAAQIAADGCDFRLHLVEWGKEVDDSKALIAELGIADKVVWLPTMKKRELWSQYCTAHAVADQFAMPPLSGVGFETMALGRRLLTFIDDDQFTHFFGSPPPCLSASSVEQCAAQLRRVVADPDDAEGIGVAAKSWMQEYHSAKRIVGIQAATYRRFLDANEAGKQG